MSMAFSASSNSDANSNAERERWNQKYREASGASVSMAPDPFLPQAFSEYILPLFPRGGRALDLAGGAGRHSIWLAKQGWEVTLIDISETGVEQARQNAGPLASEIHCVVNDLTGFKAAQTEFEAGFEVVMAFFYLERRIFSEMVKAVRPGGLFIYKTYTVAQAKLAGGPKNPAYLLQAGELLQLANAYGGVTGVSPVQPGVPSRLSTSSNGLRVLHYSEETAEKATAELVALKEISLPQPR
jgi:tellurite methyltransferase